MENHPQKGRGDPRHDINRDAKRAWNALTSNIVDAETIGDRRLAQRLRSRRNRLEREVLDRNRGLAQTFVNRFTRQRSSHHADDYLSVALTALWQAFLAWDPEREVTLASYAWTRIKGDVQRAVARYEDPGLSYGDWTARPAIRQVCDSLTQQGRPLDVTEIAEQVGVSVNTVHVVLTPPVASLDAPAASNGSSRDTSDRSLADTITVTSSAPSTTYRTADLDRGNPLLHSAATHLSATQLFIWLRTGGLDGAPKQNLNEIVAMMTAGNRNYVSKVAEQAAQIVSAELLRLGSSDVVAAGR